MHPSTDINEIKAEIEAQNHKVIKITNILEGYTNINTKTKNHYHFSI